MRIEELSHTLESVWCKEVIFGLDLSAFRVLQQKLSRNM